jgi:hypothetical protein
MSSELEKQVTEALQPPPTPVSGGILQWAPFPKAPVVYYVRFFDKVACKVNVQSAHEPKQVQAFLAELTAADLKTVSEERPLALSNCRSLASTAFTMRAVVHPSLSNGALSKTTQFMGPVTFTAFPVHPSEFTSNDTRDEIAFRLAKVVRWSNWSRPPAPALSARFLRQKTGIKSTGGKRMGIFPPPDLERIIGFVGTEDGFVEVENFERRQIRIDHADGKFEVTLGEERWVPGKDKIIPWFRIFATEGWETALKARKEYGE